MSEPTYDIVITETIRYSRAGVSLTALLEAAGWPEGEDWDGDLDGLIDMAREDIAFCEWMERHADVQGQEWQVTPA